MAYTAFATLVLFWLWVTLAISSHLVITILVYQDAKKLHRASLNISPILWTSISFVLPILGMFIYWIMNHSYLKREDGQV
jgi:hypothetical protein